MKTVSQIKSEAAAQRVSKISKYETRYKDIFRRFEKDVCKTMVEDISRTCSIDKEEIRALAKKLKEDFKDTQDNIILVLRAKGFSISNHLSEHGYLTLSWGV
jgi:uracil phosphoribosyltransferase